MIFLTTGHQSPFDRLVALVDAWAADHPDLPVFAQIGDGAYTPEHMGWTRWLTPEEFDARLEACTAVVAHAGTGTIIQVLLRGKPLLVLPRRAALGETRNDHQLGTARYFSDAGYLQAAVDDADLFRRMELVVRGTAAPSIGTVASPQLIARVKSFIGRSG